MTIAAEYREPKITEITNLQDLKKYACARHMHEREWYLNCVNCHEKVKCEAGKQAEKIMDNETKPLEKNPKDKLRDDIIRIFSGKEPVKELMKTFSEIKPTSLYSKVNIWRKNYPDLQEKYHMIEQVRFFWNPPYNSMRIPDILAKMYPEDKREAKPPQKNSIRIVPWEEMERMENERGKKPNPVSEIVGCEGEEDISLEDFLKEAGLGAEEKPTDIPAGKNPRIAKAMEARAAQKAEASGKAASYDNSRGVYIRETVPKVSASETAARDVITREAVTREVSAGGKDSGKLEDMLSALRGKIAEHEKAIADIQSKISAILTVQQMMESGV